jgi:hypothetical protein
MQTQILTTRPFTILFSEIFDLVIHCLLFLNCRVQGGVFRNDAASVLSSEIDTTSFFDTEDNESMASSRLRQQHKLNFVQILCL